MDQNSGERNNGGTKVWHFLCPELKCCIFEILAHTYLNMGIFSKIFSENPQISFHIRMSPKVITIDKNGARLTIFVKNIDVKKHSWDVENENLV